mgnify:CR=1 FL=1
MKKTVIAFFILLIFFSAVFYIGWVQFRVEPDACGIITTKLNGVYKEPIQPGKFYWNWEFLLPTNAQIKQFKVTPQNITVSTKGYLPSGQVYSAIYNSNDNFEYEFSLSMTLSVSAEQIAIMYEQGKISDNETLIQYLNTCGDTIAQACTNFYLKKLQEKPYVPVESYRRDEIVSAIKVYNEIPEVDIYQLALVSSKVPDYNLYDKMKKNYMESPVITNNNLLETMTIHQNLNQTRKKKNLN